MARERVESRSVTAARPARPAIAARSAFMPDARIIEQGRQGGPSNSHLHLIDMERPLA